MRVTLIIFIFSGAFSYAMDLDSVAHRMAEQICFNPHQQELELEVVHNRVTEAARKKIWVENCENILQTCIRGFSSNTAFWDKNPWMAGSWCPKYQRLSSEDCTSRVSDELNQFFLKNKDFIRNQKDAEKRIPVNKVCDPRQPMPRQQQSTGSTS